MLVQDTAPTARTRVAATLRRSLPALGATGWSAGAVFAGYLRRTSPARSAAPR